MGAYKVVEPVDAESVEILKHRVRRIRLAGVDEHILTIAAHKLAVALPDVYVMHIKSVHRDVDGVFPALRALPYQQRDGDQNYQQRKQGIFLCKSGKPINIAFAYFSAHNDLRLH